MNQNEYLQELKFGLEKNFPESEIQDILDEYQGFFVDGIAEGRTEEEISASLGSPARLVSTLTEDVGKTDYNANPHVSIENSSQTTGGIINKKISLPLATLGQRIGATMLDRLFIIIFIFILLIAVTNISTSLYNADNKSSSSSSLYNANNENSINGATATAQPVYATAQPMHNSTFTAASILIPVIILLTFLFPAELIGMIIFFQFFSTIIFKQAHDATGNPPSTSLIFIYFLIFVLFSFYKPIMESLWNGRTIGKRLLGIRVASEDGGSAGVGKILIRELIGDGLIGTLTGSLTTIISILTVAIGLPRKSVPDYIASTIVIIDKTQKNKVVNGERLNL